jgi:hypothetical protein
MGKDAHHMLIFYRILANAPAQSILLQRSKPFADLAARNAEKLGIRARTRTRQLKKDNH